jgi:S1-C subfamily serine protease
MPGDQNMKTTGYFHGLVVRSSWLVGFMMAFKGKLGHGFIAMILLLALILPVSVGCQACNTAHLNPTESDWQKIGKRVEPAIVDVQLKSDSYPGVLVNNDTGLVLTTFLVGGESDNVTLKILAGSEYTGQVIKVEYDSCLALVGIVDSQSINLPSVAKLGNSDALKEGDAVAAVSYSAESAGYQITGGKILAITEDGSIFVNIPYDISQLGGALINPGGEVVGILTGAIYIGNDTEAFWVSAINKAKPSISQTTANP